jgi:hypothetical protein
VQLIMKIFSSSVAMEVGIVVTKSVGEILRLGQRFYARFANIV